MIKSLQGLRVFAMLAIFLFHAGFIPNGIFPVTFFFILSGFVMYYSLYSKIEYTNIKLSFSYGLKKIKPLWKVHLLLFFVSIVIRLTWVKGLSLDRLIQAVIMNITLTHTLTPNFSLSFNNLSWYLATLFICYLFAQILIIKIKNSRFQTSSLIILFLFLQFILVLTVPNIIKDYQWFLYMSPYYRILDFTLGMIVAKLYIENKDKLINRSRLYYTLCEICVIIIFVGSYLLSFILPVQYTRGIIYTPVSLMAIYYFSLEKGSFKKLLTHNYLQNIAKYSFDFYMIHELVLIYFRKFWIEVNCSYLLKILLISIPAFIFSGLFAYILRNIRSNKLFLKYTKFKSIE